MAFDNPPTSDHSKTGRVRISDPHCILLLVFNGTANPHYVVKLNFNYGIFLAHKMVTSQRCRIPTHRTAIWIMGSIENAAGNLSDKIRVFEKLFERSWPPKCRPKILATCPANRLSSISMTKKQGRKLVRVNAWNYS